MKEGKHGKYWFDSNCNFHQLELPFGRIKQAHTVIISLQELRSAVVLGQHITRQAPPVPVFDTSNRHPALKATLQPVMLCAVPSVAAVRRFWCPVAASFLSSFIPSVPFHSHPPIGRYALSANPANSNPPQRISASTPFIPLHFHSIQSFSHFSRPASPAPPPDSSATCRPPRSEFYYRHYVQYGRALPAGASVRPSLPSPASGAAWRWWRTLHTSDRHTSSLLCYAATFDFGSNTILEPSCVISTPLRSTHISITDK